MILNNADMHKELGEFSECINCPSNYNCCSKAKKHGSIESPVMFDWEVDEVVEFYKLPKTVFIDNDRYPSSNSLNSVIDGTCGCVFFDGHSCAIYKLRPIVCKLFPFDIKEINGLIYWIRYTDICQLDSNFSIYLNNIKQLFAMAPFSYENIVHYLNEDAPLMHKLPHVVIEPLNLASLR